MALHTPWISKALEWLDVIRGLDKAVVGEVTLNSVMPFISRHEWTIINHALTTPDEGKAFASAGLDVRNALDCLRGPIKDFYQPFDEYPRFLTDEEAEQLAKDMVNPPVRLMSVDDAAACYHWLALLRDDIFSHQFLVCHYLPIDVVSQVDANIEAPAYHDRMLSRDFTGSHGEIVVRAPYDFTIEVGQTKRIFYPFVMVLAVNAAHVQVQGPALEFFARGGVVCPYLLDNGNCNRAVTNECDREVPEKFARRLFHLDVSLVGDCGEIVVRRGDALASLVVNTHRDEQPVVLCYHDSETDDEYKFGDETD